MMLKERLHLLPSSIPYHLDSTYSFIHLVSLMLQFLLYTLLYYKPQGNHSNDLISKPPDSHASSRNAYVMVSWMHSSLLNFLKILKYRQER